MSIDKSLLAAHKKTMNKNLTKALLCIKYKYFIKMTEIEDKKELLAFIKQENNFNNILQQRRADITKLF